MKIRSKLLFLIISMLCAMILSLVVFVIFQKTVDISKSEESELLLLKDLVQQEHIELSKFFFDRNVLIYQLDAFEDSIAEKNAVLERVKNIKVLSTNKKIETAL